jgi:hypothetical protein
MMKDEELHEVDVSRRKFLKLGGILGLALGALSLSSLGWSESTTDPHPVTKPWLEAKSKSKKKKGTKSKSKKTSANENNSIEWQEMA